MTMMNHHHRLLQIVFFLACAQWTLGSLDSSSSSALLEFEDWLVLHDKSYQSTQELAKRREIFLANAQVVQQHNQAYEAGVTAYAMTLASPFADLTDDEFAVSYLMESQNCSATHQSSGKVSSLIDEKYHGQSVQDLPSSIDWRTRGVITPIKNQKHVSRFIIINVFIIIWRQAIIISQRYSICIHTLNLLLSYSHSQSNNC